MKKLREFWIYDIWDPVKAHRITLDNPISKELNNKHMDVFHVRQVDLEYDRKIHNLIAACLNLYQASLRYSKITAENDIYEALKDLGEIKNENS